MLPAQGLVQVERAASDSASLKLYAELKRIMPNLQYLTLDPIHLSMVYEQLDLCLGRYAMRKTVQV